MMGLLLSITALVGHFHPVLVHLPIGILLVALLFQWLSRKEKYHLLTHAVPFLLLLGCISAVFSCITGYCLSLSDDYDSDILNWHMYLGISVAFLSFVLYARERNPAFGISKPVLSFGLLAIIFVTGHLGGSLTHGSDYLTKALKPEEETPPPRIKKIPDLNQAFVYADVVQPIFATRCYSCHGPKKQKGRFRMDDTLKLMAGGKDGKVIWPGWPDSGELIRRISLPVDNEDHMPPKEKPQVTGQQLALLQWWIKNGADFHARLNTVPQPENIQTILASLQGTDSGPELNPDIPVAAAEKADEKTVAALRSRGFLVQPVSQNSNWIQIESLNDSGYYADDFRNISLLSRQLIWLKLSHSGIGDADLALIADCGHIIRLNLSNTPVTDQGIKSLVKMDSLKTLNLSGTHVTAGGISELKTIKGLRQIFLYRSPAARGDYTLMKTAFPKTFIDTGNYRVPTTKEDTTLVKVKQAY